MPSVLVVDDSPIDRRLAVAILEKQGGLTVRSAAHGAEALERVALELPDIVLTDMQMPHMNGLELVRAMRGQYPLVPVVLMTAHGSEEIAVAALEQGAASYVPKSQLSRCLADTIRSVLAMARADRSHDRLLDCLVQCTLTFELDSDANLIYPLVDHLQQQLTRFGLCDETGRIRVGIALEEALLNAFYHGNLEMVSPPDGEPDTGLVERRLQESPYRDRRTYVRAELSSAEARFVVRDEGQGFDANAFDAQTALGADSQRSGRGLVLIRSFMDEVTFNAKGNEVTMIKRRDHGCLAEEKHSGAA